MSACTSQTVPAPGPTSKNALRILEFPLEIRMRIFELYFLVSRSTRTRSSEAHHPDGSLELSLQGPYSVRVRCFAIMSSTEQTLHGENHLSRSNWTQIFRVSRQINEEATNVLYTIFTFEFIEFPLEKLNPDIILHQIGAKQRQLIRSVRVVVVLHAKLKPSHLYQIERFSELLPNIRSIEFLPFILTFGEYYSVHPTASWSDQILRRFQYFPRALNWKVQYCSLPERPPWSLRTSYRHIWYDHIPPEDRIKLDRELSQRKSA